MPKNCSNNENVVQVELETQDRDDNAQNYRVLAQRDKRIILYLHIGLHTIKPLIWHGFEDLISFLRQLSLALEI